MQLTRQVAIGRIEECVALRGDDVERIFGGDAEGWWLLPMDLKRRWWDETDYAAREPSAALVEKIRSMMAP